MEGRPASCSSFLNSLNFFSVNLPVVGDIRPLFIFQEPSPSALETVNHNRNRWRDFKELRQIFKAVYKKGSIESFVDFGIAKGIFSEEERETTIAEFILYQDMGLGNTISLMPQAKFPNIIVNGHSLRVDAYAWLPENESFNLVIECDGYEYHSDKDTFVYDRERDRVLRNEGFEILRFSGREINQRPIDVAKEVIRYLHRFTKLQL